MTDNPNQLELEFLPVAVDMPGKLDTRGKLFALRDDPNAGFLPFSHREKTHALTTLDYLANADNKYPAGIANHLQEIFVHNRRDHGLAMAKRALVSVSYEYGDFAANAQAQHRALVDLDAEVSEDLLNPRPTLELAFPSGHLGIAPLVRFLDISAYRDKAEQRGGFELLRSAIVRHNIAEGDVKTAKNKTLQDQYTASILSEAVAQRIDEATSTLTIGEIRKPLKDAVNNESVRLAFWLARLEDTKKHGAARPTSSQVLAELRGQ